MIMPSRDYATYLRHKTQRRAINSLTRTEILEQDQETEQQRLVRAKVKPPPRKLRPYR